MIRAGKVWYGMIKYGIARYDIGAKTEMRGHVDRC